MERCLSFFMTAFLNRLIHEGWCKPSLLVALLTLRLDALTTSSLIIFTVILAEFLLGTSAGYISTFCEMQNYLKSMGKGNVFDQCTLHQISGSLAENPEIKKELQSNRSRFYVLLAKPVSFTAPRSSEISAFMMFGGFASRILVNSVPSNVRPLSQMLLLHEVGHMHPDSRHQVHRKALWLAELSILIYVMILISDLWLFVAALFLIVNRTYIDTERQLIRIDSELAADTFALRWGKRLLERDKYETGANMLRLVLEKQNQLGTTAKKIRLHHFDHIREMLEKSSSSQVPHTQPLFEFQAIWVPVVLLALGAIISPKPAPSDAYFFMVAGCFICASMLLLLCLNLIYPHIERAVLRLERTKLSSPIVIN